MRRHADASAEGRGAPGEPDDPLSRQPGRGRCRVSTRIETADTAPPMRGWLPPLVRRIVALAGVRGGELSLTVVGDAMMAELHEQYRGETGTTDVLTFDLRDDPADPLQGDIVVCLDEAARQARKHGHDARAEVLLYAVHGLMHLLGEDDHTPAGFRQMHEREDDLLTRAGVGRLFSKSDPADPGAGTRR